MRQLVGWIGLVSAVMAISAAIAARWEWAAGLGVAAVAGGFVAWRWAPRE
jgi:hypothetical protein